MGQVFGLFAKTLRFFGKSFFKRHGLRETTALPHDTTSSSRVLTAGFEFNMQSGRLQFQSERFKSGHRDFQTGPLMPETAPKSGSNRTIDLSDSDTLQPSAHFAQSPFHFDGE